ncbi:MULTISPECIES: hypothetical protein [Prauserella salsuginis group]|uniref:DUF222 domain-containing protein n=1 Tax=Prauserella salsuginis TaxID=387889 RepID=A0ABW6FYA3_9PSEU|nr:MULTISPECIES: hypothetical protein [Prauserella salsuginis group]
MTSSEDAGDGEWTDGLEIRSPEARRVADLASVGEDLSFVMRAAERLLVEMELPDNEGDSVVIRALWSAALVAYQRCFTDGKRAGLALADVEGLGLEGDALEAVGAVSDDLPGVKGPTRGERRLPGCSEGRVASFVVRAGAAGRERQREAGRAPAAAREARSP